MSVFEKNRTQSNQMMSLEEERLNSIRYHWGTVWEDVTGGGGTHANQMISLKDRVGGDSIDVAGGGGEGVTGGQMRREEEYIG